MLSRVFAVGGAPTATVASAKTRRGTAFRYTLSEPARVTIAIKAIKRRGKRRAPKGGTLVRSSPAGATTVAFSGRIGRRALRPGRYRATFVAAEPSGLTSPARAITFRVVRAQR
jgi:hypothetical protein